MTTSPLYARFEDCARRLPDKTALVADGRRLQYREMAAAVDSLARHMAALGIRPGDAVGVVLPNGAAFAQVLLACARVGALVVPQSTGSTPAATQKAFAVAGVRHLVCWHGAIGQVVDAPADGCAIALGGARPGWQAFEALLEGGRGPLPALPADRDLPYLVLLTSGSTGAPKPILLGQRTKVARADSAIALYGLGEADVVLASTPMHHSLAQRMVLIPLLSGGTSVIMRHYTPELWLEAVHAEGVSFTIAVSSQLRQIIARLEGAPSLARLRCLVSSSAAIDADSKAILRAHLGDCVIHEIYGASEVASVTDLDTRSRPDKLDTVGCPVPGAEVRILRPDGGKADAGEVGEIVCRTPLRFSGYLGDPALTRQAMCGEFFRSGDLGWLDEDGFLHFAGRIKDIVIVGGINVYPRDIEAVVERHESVLECAVIAVEDERLGEVVGIVVCPRPGAGGVDLRALRRLCATELGDAQQPHHYFELDRLPLNEMGKIDKPALRARFGRPGGASHVA